MFKTWCKNLYKNLLRSHKIGYVKKRKEKDDRGDDKGIDRDRKGEDGDSDNNGGGEGSNGARNQTTEDELMFDIEKELKGGLEESEAFFNNLFNDQNFVKTAKRQTNE
ncbi:hypothetical protein L1987_18325 [Smallanthus sonchifolius]|uniref:Uncharacterized protein n=1 Tax=Smallanthus sonchifolius TaxID=185202 RepID=A0ACB9J2W0_9ASTR|nr:hypothetical protein L1987_18325 [Smallanthus sonchifolius]